MIAEIQRLVGNLVAMHELLRDAARVSMRLVMTPDRMVVAEAMRTFTYLNLYGYLTDAVVVNRVFPDELADGYFGAWRAVQRRAARARRVRLRARAGAAGAVLRAGGDRRRACSTGSPARCSPTATPAAVLHDRLTQELRSTNGARRSCGSTCRSPSKGDVALKKIGLELVVRVDGHKRTIVLPGALAGFKPTSARARGGLARRGVRAMAEPRPRGLRGGRAARARGAGARRGGRARGGEAPPQRLERPRRRGAADAFPDLVALLALRRAAARHAPAGARRASSPTRCASC